MRGGDPSRPGEVALTLVVVAGEHLTGRRMHVRVDPALLRPAEVEHLLGDATKARRILQWTPEVNFTQLVKLMVDEDIKRLSKSSAANRVATP